MEYQPPIWSGANWMPDNSIRAWQWPSP